MGRLTPGRCRALRAASLDRGNFPPGSLPSRGGKRPLLPSENESMQSAPAASWSRGARLTRTALGVPTRHRTLVPRRPRRSAWSRASSAHDQPRDRASSCTRRTGPAALPDGLAGEDDARCPARRSSSSPTRSTRSRTRPPVSSRPAAPKSRSRRSRRARGDGESCPRSSQALAAARTSRSRPSSPRSAHRRRDATVLGRDEQPEPDEAVAHAVELVGRSAARAAGGSRRRRGRAGSSAALIGIGFVVIASRS